MTAKQAITIEQALARAAKENIHIVGHGTMKADGARFWIVSSKNYATTGRAYIVSVEGDHLHCNCPAPDICKHRAVCHQALKDEREQPEMPEGVVEVCVKYGPNLQQPAETPASVAEQAMSEHDEQEQGIAQCPRCGADMFWADSVHNAIRCGDCQHLMAGQRAHEQIKARWFHTISAEVDDAGNMALTVDGHAEQMPDLGPCVTCGKPAEELNGVVCSDHLDDPMCHECHMTDWAQVRETVARQQAERRAKREAAMIADHVPETFSIFAGTEAERRAADAQETIKRISVKKYRYAKWAR